MDGSAVRVERLRAELLQVLARIRALETRALAGPLSPMAAAKLHSHRLKVAQLRDALRRVTREDIPADPD
jgi:hypothetical protein